MKTLKSVLIAAYNLINHQPGQNIHVSWQVFNQLNLEAPSEREKKKVNSWEKEVNFDSFPFAAQMWILVMFHSFCLQNDASILGLIHTCMRSPCSLLWQQHVLQSRVPWSQKMEQKILYEVSNYSAYSCSLYSLL